MLQAIMGKKLGMTQIFDETGNRIPVTVVEAKPNVVITKRTPAKDKYSAIQVGFEEIKPTKLNKPELGHFQKKQLSPMRYLQEFRLTAEEVDAYNVGDQITVEALKDVVMIDVVGQSKGKGFQGVMKRHHFKGNTQTRGTHEYRRHSGSIGMREHPGRVLKGHRMAGQMGNERVTVQKLKLVKIDPERNLLLIHGAVPGAPGGLVVVQKSVKTKTPKKLK